MRGALDLVGSAASADLGFNVLVKGGKLVIVGLFGGAVLSGVGIALILAPAWSAVAFAALLAPVTGALLSPLIAAAAMAMSSISVVLNSARLNRFTPPAIVARPGASRSLTGSGSG